MKYNDKMKIYLGCSYIYKNRHIPSNNKVNHIPDKNSELAIVTKCNNWNTARKLSEVIAMATFLCNTGVRTCYWAEIKTI
jgi:hypothetical protein